MNCQVARLSEKALVGLSLILVSSAALAGWGVQTRITHYYTWDNGTAYFKTENNQNPDACQNSNYLALDSDAPNFKAIWGQLMLAQSTQSTVSLHYSGCLGVYPKINAIAIPNFW